MKKGKIGAFALAIMLIVGLFATVMCVEKIPAGYVGVVYNMSGGVQDEILTQGWNVVAPTKKVKRFTIGNEQIVLSQDEREGSEDDESFLVSTSDKANIRISFQMSYRYNAGSVVETYKKFKGMDGEDIVNSRVRTVIKAKISEVTSAYTMMDVYSGNRGAINTELTRFLDDILSEQFGIEVLDASIIDVHPDVQLEQAIKDKVSAMQKKQQAEAEQEAIRVESETKIIRAEAYAKEVAIQTEAEANRYKELSAAITPELLRKWEMDARLAHGWVTVQGGTPVVVENSQPNTL